MISNLLLIAGIIFLSLACRTVERRLVRKLGVLGILVVSYLIGWLFSGYWELGVALVLAWFLLPWIEILTRVRRLRLPIERSVRPQTPPPRNTFPHLTELTAEMESLKLEYILDAGWAHEKHRHFFRVFYNSQSKCDASISFIEHEHFAFFYFSFCSRCSDGRVFISWNYPFSYGLRLPRNFIVNRVKNHSPEMLYNSHMQVLAAHGVQLELLNEQNADSLLQNIQQEMQDLVMLNLKNGLLQRDGESLFRYSPNGMFFLWIQFLRDLVKYS